MKKLFILLLFVSSLGFSQSSGITYQAVIYNPNGEELPGVDNPYAPLTNQDVCLQFGIVDADGNVEYQEEVQVTTDAFGMVNLLIGTNTQTGGYATDFAGIEWSADAKFLKVDLDIRGSCTDFEELSNQPFTYVPFAYYSPASDTPGPEGPQGQDGNDGQDGATGPAGPAGSTGQAGPAGPNGQDGSTGPAGPTGPSGPQGEQGPAGADGENGNDGEGLNSLISSATEEAGENCSNGGVKILTGIDTNNNGTLDEDEVDQDNTQYICNGSNGEGGSGIGNFTGEDLVPEEIIIMSNDGVIVTSYTIPNGKYAKISAILGNAAGSASQLYPGFQDLKLDVNGVETYIGGSGVAPLSGGNGNDEQMFSDALYFPSNTVLEIGEYGATVFLEVYSLNNFIPKIITSEDIVPEGKKWKVCNILASESLIRSSASPYSHGPGNEVFINNTSIMANGGNTSQNGGGAGFDVVSFANSSFWIPEGTTLAPGANTYAVIILEFDSSQSSTGGGSGGGISLGNECLNISDIGSGTITYSSPLSAQFENLNTRNIYTHFSITNNYPYGAIEVKCFDINDDLIPVLFSGTTNASFAGFGGSTTWASSDITQSTSVFNELFSQDLSFPSTGGSEYFSRSYAILINSDVTINKIEINFLDIEGGNFKANYRLYSRFCTP